MTFFFFAEENSGKLPSPDLKRNYSQVGFVCFFSRPTFGLEKSGLFTSGKEERGGFNRGGGLGLHTGLERRLAQEGPVRASSHHLAAS